LLDGAEKISCGAGATCPLGGDVSPYNGIAKGSFSPPSLVFKHLQPWPNMQVGLSASHSAVIVLRFVLQARGQVHTDTDDLLVFDQRFDIELVTLIIRK
jgi:hypothetical protein